MIAASVDAQQITIPRIDLMPDFPQPYLMRDWNRVAQGYDSLVFDQNLTGEYLPLVFFRETTINYPAHSSFGLHTAVGTANPSAGEGINVIPAVVGATLSGIDKSDQFGENWVLMCEEYFNKRSEENIYLNHPVTRSGNDWWYETMPNIFFLQLNYFYPSLGDFDYQIKTLANQWLTATGLMGGSAAPWKVPNLNYRAWKMSTMTPLETGVKEPEAAGAIAWILYNAYLITGEREYLTGAEWNLEFLDAYPGNPSYELQLPYGVYTAARLNAELGTQYNIEKMINWCFDRGEIRGWGAIVGRWGDYDCSGLIGEANDGGNDYAFAMNGYEQAGALVPMARYDDRFATAIAKWVLNLANASRLFYPNYLPDDMQDNADWAHTYDPDSYIGYESMKEIKNNKSPFATGDAINGGWASTNLMLYGSSHVGILGGIIETTNVEAILCLDLLKTDYYRSDAYTTYLYYNPYDIIKSVGLTLPTGSFDLYDAVSNSFIASGVSGNTNVAIPSKEAVMLVIFPAGASITTEGKKTYAGDVIIDFNNENTVSDYPPRIKALEAEEAIITIGTTTQVHCTASDPGQEALTYAWTVDGVTNTGTHLYEFAAPDTAGIYLVECKVADPGNQWDTLSVWIEVVEEIMMPPEILKIEADPGKVHLSGTIELTCIAQDPDNDSLTYKWTADSGSLIADNNHATFTAPDTEGNYFIVCRVTDTDEMTDTDSTRVMVRDLSVDPTGNLIAHYSLNGNAQDASGNANHGTPGGISWVDDKEGTPGNAAKLNGISSYIHVPNNDILNFQDALSIACWIKIDHFFDHEQHPVSHGSWQNRYKISIGDQKIRFTINTSNGIKDLDNETISVAGQWYHLAVTFDGTDMEIWLDGKLDAFTSHSGLINKTTYDLAFGQHLPGVNGYNFKGVLDAVSIFDYGLSPAQILDHLENSINLSIPHSDFIRGRRYNVFPNPVTGSNINIKIISIQPEDISLTLFELSGKQAGDRQYFNTAAGESTIKLPVGMLENGMYILSVTGEDWRGYELINVIR
ncbi:MAG: T9SS type A sorting domain-containing protein [Bacteroidales bacterium]|nr:T9SS type A sorting domain-containing protein [Bacteroidales bacterium]